MIFFISLLILFYCFAGIRVLYEYQRGIVFTFGKYSKQLKPGINWIAPIFQSLRVIDLRLTTVDIPSHEAITKDNIPVRINTVVYFKVKDPKKAVLSIKNYFYAVQQYTQAAIRDVVGNEELDVLLSERKKIAGRVREIVDSETDEWGIDIQSIKIQEIELPDSMKRAMAKQAEAEREKRAMIIASSGELKSSENLKKAADMLSKNPASLQLRTLQTLRDLSMDPAQKIVIVLPDGLQSTGLQSFIKKKSK